jgi:ElaB/YqjD/DUF883 family membrane-anchored ribosome-binding protein
MEDDRMVQSNQDLMKRGGQAMDEMAERTGQGVSGQPMEAAASTARAAYESTTDAASRAYDSARDMAATAYDSAAGMARQTGSAVQRGATDFERAVGEQTDRHPLLVLGLAAGIGFLIGAWFANQGRAAD